MIDPAATTPAEATARMADGTILRTLRWPAVGEPRARALVVHGLGEHGGRYGTVAAALTAAGIEVHAYDHRGFGGSAGRRAWIERWSQLHDDLGERLATLRAMGPVLPVVVYGHSMGGLVALGHVLAEPARARPDLLVLSAPALEDDLAAWKHRTAGVLRAIVPRLRIANGVPAGGRARDPAVDAAVAADPLCLDASTVQFGAEAFDEQDRVRARVGTLRAMPLPTYVLHGSADPVVPVRASEPLGRLEGVTRRVHDGLRHESHHEPTHADVLAEVIAWLDAQLATVTAQGHPPDARSPTRP